MTARADRERPLATGAASAVPGFVDHVEQLQHPTIAGAVETSDIEPGSPWQNLHTREALAIRVGRRIDADHNVQVQQQFSCLIRTIRLSWRGR
jgi:hypothetical protein